MPIKTMVVLITGASSNQTNGTNANQNNGATTNNSTSSGQFKAEGGKVYYIKDGKKSYWLAKD